MNGVLQLLNNKPNCLDAAYELEAIQSGLLPREAAVFKDNREWGEPPPIPNSNPPVWNLVEKDMRRRNGFGISKYKTPLQAFNGRDALKDAYEEALDLCVYLRQVIYERDGK